MSDFSTTSTNFFPNQPRLIRRITRVLPDGTKETIEEFDNGTHHGHWEYPKYPVMPQKQFPWQLPTYPTHWLSTDTKAPCPCKDPKNAGKALLYYCQECSPKVTASANSV